MKKYVKIIIAVGMIGAFAFIFGLHVPFYVKHIHKQITVGQSVDNVAAIVSNSKKQPDICSWRMAGLEFPFESEGEQCTFPEDKISIDGKGDNFELTLCYIGPGFSKNDFYVTFNNNGKVVSVSDIRRWD